MSAHSCRHKSDGFTMSPLANNRWPASGPGHMIWVTCPYKFARHIPRFNVELKDWAERGFPGGAVVWKQILWVLAPDPGCEL